MLQCDVTCGVLRVTAQVHKAGPNVGRLFYVCARPSGPYPVGRCVCLLVPDGVLYQMQSALHSVFWYCCTFVVLDGFSGTWCGVSSSGELPEDACAAACAVQVRVLQVGGQARDGTTPSAQCRSWQWWRWLGKQARQDLIYLICCAMPASLCDVRALPCPETPINWPVQCGTSCSPCLIIDLFCNRPIFKYSLLPCVPDAIY
jgi:hypothetical protein